MYRSVDDDEFVLEKFKPTALDNVGWKVLPFEEPLLAAAVCDPVELFSVQKTM